MRGKSGLKKILSGYTYDYLLGGYLIVQNDQKGESRQRVLRSEESGPKEQRGDRPSEAKGDPADGETRHPARKLTYLIKLNKKQHQRRRGGRIVRSEVKSSGKEIKLFKYTSERKRDSPRRGLPPGN